MTARSLMAGAICAIFCLGTFAASDIAYAASKGRKGAVAALCKPKFPPPACPLFQASKCGPCNLNGVQAGGCVWSKCQDWRL
jgi:hypothetical protein